MSTPYKVLTPLKAIRAHCRGCCCGSYKEVERCHIDICPLWPYRLGHRPAFSEYESEYAARVASGAEPPEEALDHGRGLGQSKTATREATKREFEALALMGCATRAGGSSQIRVGGWAWWSSR